MSDELEPEVVADEETGMMVVTNEDGSKEIIRWPPAEGLKEEDD